MIRSIRRVAAVAALALALTAGTAAAQKAGGVLGGHLWDSPPNMSVLDGVNPLGARALMPGFNNLALFDQHAKQSRGWGVLSRLANNLSWEQDGHNANFP